MKNLHIIIQIVFLHSAINAAIDLQPRIIHGDPAHSGQFPYFAFLEIELQDSGKLLGCGATLISDEWLITAAHCIAHAERLVAKLGTPELDCFFEPEYVEIPIEKDNFHIHPRYIQHILWNDIGLIHLPQKVEISEDIQAVRMPNRCDSTENIEVIAIGHGGTENSSTFSSQLNFAALKTLPAKECRKALPLILFRKSVICASNDMRKQSIFDGDSGGPLVRASDGILIGISSFLQATKYDDGAPQGFTNVYSYLKWIRQITGIDLPNC